ncbi:MAG: sugar phosphate isomerase/epimerase family protein [Candidatus Promineifilaceae bacterium]|jgi:sugar phosphate isomerase/epimerase
MKPLAVQLYSLRNECEQAFENVIRELADIGYAGVETAGIPDSISVEKAAKLIEECGMAIAGAHLPLPIGSAKKEVIETALVLDTKWIVNGAVDRNLFQNLRGVLHVCDLFNEANMAAREFGLNFAVHNHWWEFGMVDGQLPYKVMLERLDPTIFFELDAYWIQVAGHDPAAIVKEFGKRAPLIHLKDGPAENYEDPMTAVGEGAVDYPAVVEAAEDTAEWLIVELDRCETNMMEAIRNSYQYLTSRGLAHGR